ncbi:helix-turn-helix domain-containing protein [Xanthomarina sp. GH4-25]|uniref:helix-turn-helix domain-containing protein n=1 Tax=Xanthomarina sp. GH4-25 TaxID=3349335 RepID=UPI00387821A6
MNFITQILFFFGAIGVFNSFIVAVYFLINKSYSNLSNRLFGLFLLILNLRILKSLFYAFSTDDPVWFLQSGPSFFLLIGPLFFCYTLSVCKPNSFWIKYWKHHILFWLGIVIFLMIFVPFKEYNDLNKTIILPIINLQWLFFILLSGIFIKSNFITQKNNQIKKKWLLVLTLAVLTLWSNYTFMSFDYFISGSIVFSILFYLFFVYFLIKKRYASKIFEKTKKKNILSSSRKDQHLINQLNEVMVNEKLFLNTNLKIAEVAEKLDISTHELSKLINDSAGKNFTDFINEYRIEQAKQLIQDNSLYTIEAIGNQSGFNSKSAFYKAFNKFTKTTPAKYKAQQSSFL